MSDYTLGFILLFQSWFESFHPCFQGEMGYLYLDLYSRAGKYTGCANFAIKGGRRLSETEYQLPVCFCRFHRYWQFGVSFYMFLLLYKMVSKVVFAVWLSLVIKWSLVRFCTLCTTSFSINILGLLTLVKSLTAEKT